MRCEDLQEDHRRETDGLRESIIRLSICCFERPSGQLKNSQTAQCCSDERWIGVESRNFAAETLSAGVIGIVARERHTFVTPPPKLLDA